MLRGFPFSMGMVEICSQELQMRRASLCTAVSPGGLHVPLELHPWSQGVCADVRDVLNLRQRGLS